MNRILVKEVFNNWKLGIHLLFRTYRFGVNNKWWNNYDSMFGLPWYQRINPLQLYKNYLGIKFRIIGCYFVSNPWDFFPKYMKKYYPWRGK